MLRGMGRDFEMIGREGILRVGNKSLAKTEKLKFETKGKNKN